MLKLKSRKGEGLVEVFSIFLIVFFTFMFMLLFSLPSCSGPPEQKILSDSLTGLKTDYDLSAYLRAPVSYNGMDLTVADLIALSMENETIRKKLVPKDVFFVIDIAAYGQLIDQKTADLQEHPLALSAANLMKTYADYIPYAAKKEWFCSFIMDATRGSEKIMLYDSRYSWYDASSCGYEYPIAEAQIPDFNGNPITVAIKATVDKSKILATVLVGPLMASHLGIY